MQGLIARAAMIVDAADEEAARRIGDDFIAWTKREAIYLGWSAYTKLGPQSRLMYAIALTPDAADGQGVVDEIEAIAGVAVAPDALINGYLNGFLQEDGSLVYNRIFDARTDAFLVPGILWLDLEINTNAGAQAEQRKLVAAP